MLQCPLFVEAFRQDEVGKLSRDSIAAIWAEFVESVYTFNSSKPKAKSKSKSKGRRKGKNAGRLWASPSYIEPYRLKDALQGVDRRIGTGLQQDAFIVIAALLRGIDRQLSLKARSVINHKIRVNSVCELPSDEELSQTVESLWFTYALEKDNIVRRLFDGVAAETLTCCDCDYTLMKFQKFRVISLPTVDKRITLKIRIHAPYLRSDRGAVTLRLAYDNTLKMLRCLVLNALQKTLELNNMERDDVELQFGRRRCNGERAFSVLFFDDNNFSDCSSIAPNDELFVTVLRRDTNTKGLLAPPFPSSGRQWFRSNTKPRVLESVAECLEVYEAREATDSCTMICRECDKTPDIVMQQMSVLRAPQILTLHIARENLNLSDEDYGKSRRLVTYPIDEPLNFKGYLYDLFGVTAHHGFSTDGGHYTAKVKSLRDGKWYTMNDSCKPVQLTHTKADRNATVLMFNKRGEGK